MAISGIESSLPHTSKERGPGNETALTCNHLSISTQANCETSSAPTNVDWQYKS